MLSLRQQRKFLLGYRIVNSNLNETQVSRTSLSGQTAAPLRERHPRVLTVLPDFPFPATTGLHLRMISNLELVQ